MEYNPIDDIWVFMKEHLRLPFLYMRKKDDKRISAVFKGKDDDNVILLIYKSDKGYVLQFDDDDTIVILRKTRFNNFVPVDYHNPDKPFNMPNSTFSKTIIERIFEFLNSRFQESSLFDYCNKYLKYGESDGVECLPAVYEISPTLKLQVSGVLDSPDVLELKFNEDDGKLVISKNDTGTDIKVIAVHRPLKAEALEFFNDFKQTHNIQESFDMNDLSIETKRADIGEKSSLYDIVKRYLIDYPLKHSIFTNLPCSSILPLKQVLMLIGVNEIVYVEQTEDPDILNISFRLAPFKWVIKMSSNRDKMYLVLDVDTNNIANPNIQNFVDYLCVKLEVITQTQEANKVNVDNPTSETVEFVPRAEDMFVIATEYLKTLPNIYRNQHYLDGTDGRFEFKIAPTTARVNCIMHKVPAGIFLIMGENRLRFDFELTRFNRVVAKNRAWELDEDDEETNECISFVNLFLLKYLNTQYKGSTSTDMRILRNHIVDAIKALPSFKSIIDRISTPSLSDTITLIHNNKTVSLDIGIEDDVCVLRSSEMYANYQFKYSRFGNISMQRILHPLYSNEVIGACLTTDAVNEILCYLTDKYKKVSLFDYIKPTLNTWACGDNVLKSKLASPNQSYLILLRNYKSLTIKETSIPEQLHFTTTNCFDEEGFIKIADNGEDIEIVLDRTKFQDKEVQAFIDHLIKELNAVVSIKRTRPTIILKESNMQTQYSKNDKLFDTITQYIGKLSVASKPCNIPCYVVPHKTGDVACTIRKCKDGVIVNSNGQKLFKFWINMFDGVSYRNEDNITNELDDVMLDIKNQLSHDYPEICLHDYLYSNLFNKYPPTEHQHTFKINLLATVFETLKITKIDEDKCLLTFDIEECPYSFLLAKSVYHDEINVAYTTISLELPESLKPTFDNFVERFNLTWTSHNAALGISEDMVVGGDTCDVIVEDSTSYPVILRTSSTLPTKDNVHHLIGEGVRLIEEAYRHDNTSITVSDTVSIMCNETNSGFRESRLRHSRIYRVSSDNLFTGQFIVILPNTNIPQVRVELAHRIGVDSETIEQMVFDHDYLYGKLIKEAKQNKAQSEPGTLIS